MPGKMWNFILDPALQNDPRLEHQRELKRAREEREARAGRTGSPGRPPVLGELVAEDRLRIRLQDLKNKRELSTGQTPSKNLSTVAGVHALSFATRYIEGGRERFLEFIQLAVLNNHAAAVAFYHVFVDLNLQQREIVSFDDVCSAAGVRPSDLMSCVVACAIEMSRDTGNLVAAITHPDVVRQAAKSGKRIGGDYAMIGLEDRRMLFQHSGFIPVPKNTIVNVHASANAQAAAIASASEPTVPKFSDDLGAIAPASAHAPTPKFLEPPRDPMTPITVDPEAIAAELISPDD